MPSASASSQFLKHNIAARLAFCHRPPLRQKRLAFYKCKLLPHYNIIVQKHSLKSFWAICSVTQILSNSSSTLFCLCIIPGLKLLTENPCSCNRICGTISFLKSLPSSYQGLLEAWLWERKNWEWMKTTISSQKYCEHMVGYFSFVCWGFFAPTVQRLNVNLRGDEIKKTRKSAESM